MRGLDSGASQQGEQGVTYSLVVLAHIADLLGSVLLGGHGCRGEELREVGMGDSGVRCLEGNVGEELAGGTRY